jgi:spermidine/putrescine transport system permease protein
MMVSNRRSASEVWGWAYVGPALIWTAVFFLLPFALMVAVSLSEPGSASIGSNWTLGNYAKFLDRGDFLDALQNSVEIALTSTLISILLAYPLAWIIAEMVPRHLQRYALILAVIPFWTSYVVRSYAWLLVLSRHGILNESLAFLGLISEPLNLANTRTATVIGFVHFFVMLLTLTIYANLTQLPPNYRRAAADLGASSIRIFFYVILPLTLPGIMVGAFLSFVLCVGDYITPQILGGSIEIVMPQLIMLQVSRRADFSTASALSIVLMLVVTVAYLACARYLKLERV